MNQPTPQERTAMSQRYTPPKKLLKWVVVHMGREVYESIWPALCDYHIKQYNLVGAFKRLVI